MRETEVDSYIKNIYILSMYTYIYIERDSERKTEIKEDKIERGRKIIDGERQK